MAPMDPVRISKTLSYLLKHKPEHGNLTLDEAGWVELTEVAAALGKMLRTEIDVERVRIVVDGARVRRFEISSTRIRAVSTQARGGRVRVPDILYHATDTSIAAAAQSKGFLEGGRRPVLLSADESSAWRAAHRMATNGSAPEVLFVDAARASRHGVRFRKTKAGLFATEKVSVRDVLNLRDNFAHQLSAGGFPLALGSDGAPRMALIRVTRRSGTTWEVAKGKLEPGETPEATAVREVQEEMGIDIPMDVIRHLGDVRYGFMAPGGLPRLKTVYLYFLRPLQPLPAFVPSEREGIGDVRWFTPAAACRAVRHSSLLPMMHRARQLMASGAVPLDGLVTLE